MDEKMPIFWMSCAECAGTQSTRTKYIELSEAEVLRDERDAAQKLAEEFQAMYIAEIDVAESLRNELDVWRERNHESLRERDEALKQVENQKKTIEDLQAELKEISQAINDDRHDLTNTASEIISELRTDAERYRFAKSRAYVGVNPHAKTCLWILRGIFEVKYDPQKIHGFDAAIDEALDNGSV